QRYFAVNDAGGGLMPLFLAVANVDPALGRDDAAGARAAMTAGYERVLTARLEDGRFFFAEDGKKSLEQRLDALQGMAFQKGAGDFFMKSGRLKNISEWIVDKIEASKDPNINYSFVAEAARLSKADLASSMVFEFPELQGVIGGIYARGEKPGKEGADEVADGIAQHYLPSSASDPLPSSITGAVVSVADKIDSLMAFLALGYKPSATSDPLGMRRLCLGIIRIAVEGEFGGRKLTFNLRHLAEFALEQVESEIEKTKKKKKIDDPVGFFMEFLEDRLKVYWKDRARADILDAVIACGIEDLRKTRMRLEALIEFQRSDEFEDLSVAFKRAYRISRELDDDGAAVDTGLFQQAEEKELHEAVQKVTFDIDIAYRNDDFKKVYSAFRSLRKQIDGYFEKVFVNVEEEDIKVNRLRMMKMIADLVVGSARLDLVQFERTKLE
ncbi:MAG: glycine--tRNA ligase subunit beta, partial [Pseudomonadota bacterium]